LREAQTGRESEPQVSGCQSRSVACETVEPQKQSSHNTARGGSKTERCIGSVSERCHQKDRLCLSRVAEEYAKHDIIRLFVNPTVKWEIEKTANLTRRKQLLQQFDRLHFIPFSTSVFPILFPVTFISTEVNKALDDIFACLPEEYKKDMKILADVMSSEETEILLTTDREHLANKKFRGLVKDKGLDKKITIVTPKELLRRLGDVGTKG